MIGVHPYLFASSRCQGLQRTAIPCIPLLIFIMKRSKLTEAGGYIRDHTIDKRRAMTTLLSSSLTSKGQALVEFTLIFVLLLVVSWIPAEFGLAFYTSQIAQNAVREGARIAAADLNPAASAGWCDIPACYSGANILKETSLRLPAALMSNIRVTLTVDAPSDTTCNEMVTVSATGQFHFFFYQILRLLGATASDTRTISTSARMRWEHQAACNPVS